MKFETKLKKLKAQSFIACLFMIKKYIKTKIKEFHGVVNTKVGQGWGGVGGGTKLRYALPLYSLYKYLEECKYEIKKKKNPKQKIQINLA